MMSDSDDTEEFFDAQDATPVTSSITVRATERCPDAAQSALMLLGVSEGLSIEEEKRLVLAKQQEILERRRLEEEQLQRHLDDIERRERERAEKLAVERKATEAHEHQQRLASVRRVVYYGAPNAPSTSSEGSPISGNPSVNPPPLHLTSSSERLVSMQGSVCQHRREILDVSRRAVMMATIAASHVEPRYPPSCPALVLGSRGEFVPDAALGVDLGVAVLGCDDGDSVYAPRCTMDRNLLANVEFVDKSSSKTVDGMIDDCGSDDASAMRHFRAEVGRGGGVSVGFNDAEVPRGENILSLSSQGVMERETVPTRTGIEAQSPCCGQNTESLSGEPGGLAASNTVALSDLAEAFHAAQGCGLADEPDIIRSTKWSIGGGSLGRTPPPRPVAPPHSGKRESGAEGADEVPPGEGEEWGGEGAVAPPSRSSLTRDLDRAVVLPGAVEGVAPTLDLPSATRGQRVVTAYEIRAVNSGEDGSGWSPYGYDPNTAPGTVATGGGADLATLDEGRHAVKSPADETANGRERGTTPVTLQRLRSNSGSRELSDKEILDQVIVVNLDTGESLPLSAAEEKLPRCLNPLSLHIMRRTKEYNDPSQVKRSAGDEEPPRNAALPKAGKPGGKKKTTLRRLFAKTGLKKKTKADDVFQDNQSDDDEPSDTRRTWRVKSSNTHKGPYDFDLLVLAQELIGGRAGAVWTMKFSHCGRLLATGGQDCVLRVWVLRDAFAFFDDMRQKYAEAACASPPSSPDGLSSPVGSAPERCPLENAWRGSVDEGAGCPPPPLDFDGEHMPFMRSPFCVYKGHSADLLDISWSKNYFLLSSSMDKTVRLWHISRQECLCCFQHIDFVTAIAFHPKDDRYFLSGSLDGKLRLWNIPDKRVALWNEVTGGNRLITAANFCLNGRFAVVGTYDGRCVFFTTEQLKYYTQIHVRSTRGKNARGRKITGVEPYPGEDKILVTSNDSRIRLYDLRDLTLTCKYKGCLNSSSQIKASFSYDGKYIICGSEDRFVYVWRTQHEVYKFSSARRDRNDFWEGVKAHDAVVTNAIFAPCPELIIRPQFAVVDPDDPASALGGRGEVLVSADYNGTIKVFLNKFKPT